MKTVTVAVRWVGAAAMSCVAGVGAYAVMTVDAVGALAGPPRQGEYALVYVGSSACGWSESERMETLFKGARKIVEGLAEREGYSAASVGVALDWSPSAGLGHLGRFPAFDEIVVGRGLFGRGAQDYIWSQHPGPAATPQILVLRREWGTTEASPDRYMLTREEVVVRKVGLHEIESWIDLGGPLPVAGSPKRQP